MLRTTKLCNTKSIFPFNFVYAALGTVMSVMTVMSGDSAKNESAHDFGRFEYEREKNAHTRRTRAVCAGNEMTRRG